MTNLVPSTSYYKHTWFRVIWVPTGLSAKILQPPPSFRTFHTFSSLIQDLGLPWFPHYPQVSGEEDITPSFLLFHLRIQGASHSSARPQAGADWCHSLMASILNCWMQPRSCVFLTQPQNSWTTALPLPRANRIDHWECKSVLHIPAKHCWGQTPEENSAWRNSLCPTPHCRAPSYKRTWNNKESFQSTGMLVGLFWGKLQLLTASM